MNDAQYYLDHLDALESDSEVLSLIRRIQHDAWKSGMTIAAQIAESSLCTNTVKAEYAMNVSTVPRDAILKSRDAKGGDVQ